MVLFVSKNPCQNTPKSMAKKWEKTSLEKINSINGRDQNDKLQCCHYCTHMLHLDNSSIEGMVLLLFCRLSLGVGINHVHKHPTYYHIFKGQLGVPMVFIVLSGDSWGL